MEDNINHPKHYELDKIECIDAMEMTQGRGAVMSFCLCNAFKYLWRHDRKNGLEDIKKAKWYLDKYLELAEKSKKEINEKFGYMDGGYCDTDDCYLQDMLKKDHDEFSPHQILGSLREYYKRKRDEFDAAIDEIAAEHKKPCGSIRPLYLEDDPDEEALEQFCYGNAVILFETPTDYCDFRIKYSDRFLLPKPESIYGKHPEILEHDWPVVIVKDLAPCPRISAISCCRYGGVKCLIPQSDWRETKTVDGKKIYIYSEKEWA